MDQRKSSVAHVSGGVRSLFLFLLEEMIQLEAMYPAFLFHAINEGMDMGIVNPSMLEIYDNIPKDLLIKVEDVLFNRTENATEELLSLSEFKEWYKSGVIKAE